MYRVVHREKIGVRKRGQEIGDSCPARKTTKQGVYAVIYHDNLKQKASVLFVSLKEF